MSPSNAWEALRIAWLMWRHPDRVAALVGVKQEYTLEHWKPHPQCDEAGLTIPEVSMISGHMSWSNLKRYTHLRPEAILEKLDAGA